MCNLSESIYRDGEKKGSKKVGIRIICRMLAKGMEVPDILDIAEVNESFVDAVIHKVEGNLSTDEANISRIYKAVYQLGA